jgi:hypothetical protein
MKGSSILTGSSTKRQWLAAIFLAGTLTSRSESEHRGGVFFGYRWIDNLRLDWCWWADGDREPWPITCATVFRPHAQKNSMPIGWWHTLILPGGPAIASVCSPSINLFFAQPLSRFHEPDAHAVACQAKQASHADAAQNLSHAPNPTLSCVGHEQLLRVAVARPAGSSSGSGTRRRTETRTASPHRRDEDDPVRHHRFNLHDFDPPRPAQLKPNECLPADPICGLRIAIRDVNEYLKLETW